MAARREFNVAVVGATGAVGREMIRTLERRNFPVGELYPLASARSAGRAAAFRGERIPAGMLAAFDFAQADLALFSAGGEVSGDYAPQAAAAGCVVVDNSSRFRRDADIPLVVTEVNPHRVGDYRGRNIVANPNCSTMQMLVALKPIHDAAGLARINVATYQAASGAGARAVADLEAQTRTALEARSDSNVSLDSNSDVNPVSPTRVAFNAVPHIDPFQENGYTREEMKLAWETQKILEDDSILVNATAVRIPVFTGHSEAVHLETRKKLSADAARELLRGAPGVRVVDERATGGYPTAASHAAGRDEVFVGRLRDDFTHPHGLSMWIVGDNLRKGAALNAVQIAELLAAEHL